MKHTYVIVAMALQLAVLGYMAGEREWVVRSGRTAFLRTAPVDPRDVMRGDYVRLNYEISSVPRSLCRGVLAVTNAPGESTPRDVKVFALMREDQGGVLELTALADERPRDGLFIRGRTERSWNGRVAARYGLEAYFMEQGKGSELEQSLVRDGIQVPLEMETAIGRSGLAVLKGHRWSALGIGLDLETAPAPQPNWPLARSLVAAKVKLMNVSSNNLAIVDLPGGRSLTLVSDVQWGTENWEWIAPDPPAPKPANENVIVLKPGTTHSMRVDFRDPRWRVQGREEGNGKTLETRSLTDLRMDATARFRFEYRPPNRETCAGLPSETVIWHGRMPTRAFNPGGAMD